MGVDLELYLLLADAARVAFDKLRIVKDEAALKGVNSIEMGWMRRRDNKRSGVGVDRLIDSIGNVKHC